ncbi:LysR family transcriptional regulator [Rhizobium sp. R635]|uniref:LysR family transcriptional regulator n=1 Tax=Rhizobium sp. R635 TaxID=1764275 RepID=UPI000B52E572|nr:LysR family transcriptional regulator [Rhizobium sp. R635]OWV89876.1 LysR family transcriptional regulator [Rhizobium sp. R635]
MSKLLNLNRLAYFTTVIEAGSFTAAADRLNVAKAVVSHQVGRLEEELAVTLLVRSTRRVRPTDAGRQFYERASQLLREAESAFADVARHTEEPTGLLRLTAPLDYGTAVVAETIATYLKTYPQMRVEANFDDMVSNLVDDERDLGIRVGWLADSSNVSRKIGTFHQVVVASPALAARLGPVSPADTPRLPWIGNEALRHIGRLSFSRGDEQVLTEFSPLVTCDKTAAVYACMRSGIGLGIFPDFSVAAEVQSGRLVRMFPDWLLPSGGIYAVFPPARFRPAKVRAFVDLLAETERRRSAARKMSQPSA